MLSLPTGKATTMPHSQPFVEVTPKCVLVAYDFTETSQKPLFHGVSIARHYGAKLYVVHVVSSVGYRIAGADALRMATEKTQAEMQQLEQALLKGGALADIPHEFIVREGEVWHQLEDVIQQKHADVVVVGTHARGGLRKLLLGSVAEQVFRQACCPVVTVGPCAHEEFLIEKKQAVQPFLMATDFGAASLCALPHAVSFANHFGAKLIVLHVLPAAPIPEGFHWSKTGDLMEMREESKKESQKRFEELIRPHVPPERQLEFEVKFGIPSEQILQASREHKADLIVLGLNRRAHVSAASHTPWASAYKIVGTANCPVLTIRS